jgi:hypothetical protein
MAPVSAIAGSFGVGARTVRPDEFTGKPYLDSAKAYLDKVGHAVSMEKPLAQQGTYNDPMKTDKGQFDEVLGRMLKKPPQKTATIHAKKRPKKDTNPSQDQK